MSPRLTALLTIFALTGIIALAGHSAVSSERQISIKQTANPAAESSYSVQGDSLSVMARPYFKKSLPGFKQRSFSAKIGRHYWDGQKILKRQRLGRVVIFALGSNSWQSSGAAWRKAIRQTLALIGSKRCLVMATIYDQKPITSFNRIIYQEARRAGSNRLQVAGWAARVESGRVALADGLHPRSKAGARTFAHLLAAATKRC